MPEAWIQLVCPACGSNWEANPGDLPAPGDRFACPHCGARRPIAQFARTQRDFEILESLHEA